MVKKIFVVMALFTCLMAFFATNSMAWPTLRTIGSLSIGSPYKMTWYGTGNIDGTVTGSAEFVDAAIEWVNPTDKSVSVGLGGEDPITTSSAAKTYYDDNGHLVIESHFPYEVDDCSEVPGCAELIPYYGSDPLAETYAFLEFYYGVNWPDYWYKDNWLPERMIAIEVLIWAHVEEVLNPNNTKTEDSPTARCITTETYRTFDPYNSGVTYICNDLDDPFAIDDNYVMKKDSYSDDVLVNDFDREENYPLTAQLVEGPQNGNLTLNDDGTFTYTMGDTFEGSDNFSYITIDSSGNESNVAWVTLTAFK